MDKNDYRIETLAKAFSDHADKCDKSHQRRIRDHCESFPNSEVPEWMKDHFNISRALSVMAAEIERLKTICN